MSGKQRSVVMVDMGKDKVERFGRTKGGGGVEEEEEEGGLTEIEPDWKAGKENRNAALVDMARMAGRERDGGSYVDELGVEVREDGGGGDGDRLVLEKERGETFVKFQGHVVGESISKQPDRWAARRGEGGEGEGEGSDVAVGAEMTRRGEMRTKTYVKMDKESGREGGGGGDDVKRGVDDMGVEEGRTEGDNLVLDVKLEGVEKDLGKCGIVYKETNAIKLEKMRAEFKEREKREKEGERKEEKAERRERRERKRAVKEARETMEEREKQEEKEEHGEAAEKEKEEYGEAAEKEEEESGGRGGSKKEEKKKMERNRDFLENEVSRMSALNVADGGSSQEE